MLTDLALTLACSLILFRLDYCNAVLHGAPVPQPAAFRSCSACRTPQRKSFCRFHDIHHLNHCWNSYTGYQVHQHIDYKLAVLMYKIHNTSTLAYLSHHIRPRESTHHLHSSAIPLLHRPTTRTHLPTARSDALFLPFLTLTLCVLAF